MMIPLKSTIHPLKRRPVLIFLAPILWGLLASKGYGAEPLPDALAQMKSPDVIKRRIAAQELVTMRNPGSAPALIEALSDKDAYVRTLAARALGNLRWAEAAKPLANAALTDKSPTVRQTALLSLRFLGETHAVPTLQKALNDPDETVRATAANNLAFFHNPASAQALVDATKDVSPVVRRNAYAALGQMQDASNAPALLVGIKDSDPWVRANAAQALGLVHYKDAVPALKELLKDPESVARVAAAQGLAYLGDTSGRAIAEAGVKDANPAVRFMAQDALKEMPGAQKSK
jgi:HEAT repeat protein